MLVLLRIIFTGFFIYCAVQARDNARDNLLAGDMMNAFWVGAGVLTAIACAIVWAPYIGAKVADPLTGGLVNSASAERKNRLLQFIRWLDKKERAPALIRWLCFIEGVRAPWLPAAFNIGLIHSRPGSWLERVYAKEVFRFNNAENCMRAFVALQRQGIDPRPHASPDVNTVLLSVQRAAAPDPEIMAVPQAPPPPPLKRDQRIRIGVD
ncbi:MAG: hypothetical protein ACXW3Z_12725 [Limisphaerales bacterium]